MDTERRRGISCRYDYLDEIQDYLADAYPDFDVANRAIENALRRRQLKFYQIGQRRFTTPEFIDEWLDSCILAPRPGTKSAAAQA